jgi:hypothetical protein
MDAKHRRGIERRVPAKQPLPDHGDHCRRHDDLRKIPQTLLFDFAALDGEFDQRETTSR